MWELEQLKMQTHTKRRSFALLLHLQVLVGGHVLSVTAVPAPRMSTNTTNADADSHRRGGKMQTAITQVHTNASPAQDFVPMLVLRTLPKPQARN